MGGTWIFHTQPYTHREVMRYKMDLICSRDPSHKNDFYSINVPGETSAVLLHNSDVLIQSKRV
jgi:hypothetical protein